MATSISSNQDAPARKFALASSPPATGTLGSIDAMIADFSASGADCGPHRGKVMAIGADLRACRNQIMSTARSYARRLDLDAIARSTFARGERPELAWFGQLQATLRDRVGEKKQSDADAAANELVEDARALKVAIEGDEARALGPAPLRTKSSDLARILRDANMTEDARARRFVEVFETWRALVARGDEDADAYGDAIERVALAVARESDGETAKRLGPRAANREGVVRNEQAAATQFLAQLRARRTQSLPLYLPACRAAWAKLIAIWPQLVGMNAWMLAPSQLGTDGPRVGYDWRDELAIDPQWSTRLLPPWPRGIRLPWSPLAHVGEGA